MGTVRPRRSLSLYSRYDHVGRGRGASNTVFRSHYRSHLARTPEGPTPSLSSPRTGHPVPGAPLWLSWSLRAECPLLGFPPVPPSSGRTLGPGPTPPLSYRPGLPRSEVPLRPEFRSPVLPENTRRLPPSHKGPLFPHLRPRPSSFLSWYFVPSLRAERGSDPLFTENGVRIRSPTCETYPLTDPRDPGLSSWGNPTLSKRPDVGTRVPSWKREDPLSVLCRSTSASFSLSLGLRVKRLDV